MRKKPNFTNLISLLEANEDFSITEKQYLKSTGADMPKGTYYLKNNSAFSKLAEQYGYTIEINERTISLKKAI